MKKVWLKLHDLCKQSCRKEDRIVFRFINSLKNDNEIRYLEVGAGAGGFVKRVKAGYRFDITAVEINRELAEKNIENGIETLNIDFLKNNFADDSFDVTHCSHVIEHIPYPAIIDFLDELVRVTKIGGCVIIRSPLMKSNFFFDIDHIRPYPPQAILNYYSNEQQQRVGKYKVQKHLVKILSDPIRINPYSLTPFWRSINMLFRLLHIYLGLSLGKAGGYVAIFRKEKIS